MPTERYAKGKGHQDRVREREVKRKMCQGKEVSGERDVRETKKDNKCQGKETTRGRDAKGKGCQETARCQGKELTGGRDAKR